MLNILNKNDRLSRPPIVDLFASIKVLSDSPVPFSVDEPLTWSPILVVVNNIVQYSIVTISFHVLAIMKYHGIFHSPQFSVWRSIDNVLAEFSSVF